VWLGYHGVEVPSTPHLGSGFQLRSNKQGFPKIPAR
jgi:hypothetical protein